VTSGENHGSAGKAPFRPGLRARVASVPSHSQPMSMRLREGEELTAVGYDERWPGYVLCGNLQGESGWVPESMLLYLGPGMAVVRGEYSASVLPVAVGDALTLQREWNGWYWATRADGQAGWVFGRYVEWLDKD
jgi:hypothetical protein